MDQNQQYSAFDPNIFLDAQQTEVNERRNPLPVDNPATPDGLYVAVIGEPKTKTGTIEKGERTGQAWVMVTAPLVVDVPQQLQDSLKLPPQLTFNDMGFLDLTPDQRGLDNSPGKNRFQRKYREALDLNKAGTTWSWQMAQGRPVKIKLNWKMIESNGESFPVEEVVGVFKA